MIVLIIESDEKCMRRCYLIWVESCFPIFPALFPCSCGYLRRFLEHVLDSIVAGKSGGAGRGFWRVVGVKLGEVVDSEGGVDGFIDLYVDGQIEWRGRGRGRR